MTLPAGDRGETPVRLSSSFLDLLQLTHRLEGREQASFRIAGEVKFGGFGLFGTSLSIDREGSLPLSGSLSQRLPGSPPLGPPEPGVGQPLRQ